MWTRWYGIEPTFTPAHLQRQVDRALAELGPAPARQPAWPRASFYESETQYRLEAEVPGLTDKDVQVTLQAEVLTLAGERKIEAPEGFEVKHQERASRRFSRTFTLPGTVDAAGVEARVKDGVLTVTLPKSAEKQPRRIDVRAA